MKGYWHIAAIGVAISMLTIILHSYIFFIIFFGWILYLFFTERIKILPLIISSIFCLFFFFYIPKIFPPPPDSLSLEETEQTLIGEVISPPSYSDTKIDFIFLHEDTDDQMIVQHFLNQSPQEHIDRFSSIKYGATCQITGKIEIPDSSTNPGQFDYQHYLLSQGITYQFIIEDADDFYCKGKKPLDLIYSFRLYLIQTVTNLMSEETSAWLNALVLGDDSHLDDEIIDLFERWSLSHVLAISGLHVGLITALIYFLLVKLNIVTKETAQWMIIFFLPIYALLAGSAPSVWRASLMGVVFLMLTKTRIKYSLTDALSLIFIGLILFDPYIVYQISFQFSFLVTFGLILSRNWLFQHQATWQILKISFVAQMIILPLQITYFSTFHPLSILLNSIIVPYFSLFVIPTMFLLMLFSPVLPVFVSGIDYIFAHIQDVAIQLLIIVDDYLYFPWITGEFPLVYIFVYYGAFVIFMALLEKKCLKKAFYYGVFITCLLTLLVLRPYLSPVGQVTMLDMGQGDVFVIELPYRKGVFFADAGATFSFTDFETSDRVYAQVIKPYLYSRGINKIDAVFISHDHLDHDGSVPFMVDEMNVDHIIVSPFYEFRTDDLETYDHNNVLVHYAEAGDEIVLAGQTFRVLAPQQDANDENENSLVFQTDLGGKSWIFTGDIGKKIERNILKHNPRLNVDVLKVAHHGSNTSTDPAFIKKTNPTHALISVGKNNRFDHPDEEVIKTLENEDILILRTDQHGAVQYKFTGEDGTFFKYLP